MRKSIHNQPEAEGEEQALSRLLASAAPEVPTARLWAAISARLDQAPAAPEPSWWQRLLAEVARPVPATSLVAACLAMGLLWAIHEQPGLPHVMSQPALASAPVAKAKPALAAKAKAPKPAVASAAMPASAGQAATAKPDLAAPALAAPAPELAKASSLTPMPRDLSQPFASVQQASTGGQRFQSAYAPAAGPAGAAQALSLPAAQGRATAAGWDWDAFQSAMEARNSPQAAAELSAARSQAASKAERSLAASAIHLLTQPGQPLEGYPLDDQGDAFSDPKAGLVVEQAVQWDLNTTQHLAGFGGLVQARVPGLRADGPSLTLDWASQSAQFGAGTRFIRTANESLAQVVDASGAPVKANEFRARDGAVYDLAKGQMVLH
jgi:hypothetical protein